MEEVIKIIKKFLQRFDVEEIEGVLLYGSAVSGKLDENSDIDILVCINSKPHLQSVGCAKIDNKKIEYFVHNIENIYDLALKEVEKNDLSHLTKFITSKIVYDKNGNFTKEVNKIRDLYDLPMKECHDNQTKKTIFHIKNRLDDLNSLKETDSFYVVFFNILNMIRELNTKINGYIVIPLAKSESLFKDRQYLIEYIKSNVHKAPDERFIEKYLLCLKIEDKEIMIKNINDLYEYVIKNEKFDPEEFNLDFETTEGFGI